MTLVDIVRASGRRGHIHERDRARDEDLLARRELKLEIHRRGRVERDGDRVFRRSESGKADLDLVDPGRHAGNAVSSVPIARAHPCALQVRARRLDRGAGNE